jgi:hypothetical protein
LENSAAGKQKTGIRIGADAQRILLDGEVVNHCPVPTEDLRPKSPDSN